MIKILKFTLHTITYKRNISLLRIFIAFTLFTIYSCNKEEEIVGNNFDLTNISIERITLNTHIYHIDFIDNYFGIGINSNNIYSTQDGGYNWNLIYESENLHFINLFDKNNILVSGKESSDLGNLSFILVSNDAGTTFEKIYLSEITSAIFSISTFFDGTGFVTTHNGIIKSTNYGKSWEKVLNINRPINKVIKSLDGKLYCGSSDGIVLISTNNGSNWSQIKTPFEDYIYIKKIENNRIFFLYGGILYSTEDFVKFYNHNINFSNNSNYLHILANGNMAYFGSEYSQLGGFVPSAIICLSSDFGNKWEKYNFGVTDEWFGFEDGIKINDEQIIILAREGYEYNQLLHINFLNN